MIDHFRSVRSSQLNHQVLPAAVAHQVSSHPLQHEILASLPGTIAGLGRMMAHQRLAIARELLLKILRLSIFS
jgi:hypothetical protein